MFRAVLTLLVLEGCSGVSRVEVMKQHHLQLAKEHAIRRGVEADPAYVALRNKIELELPKYSSREAFQRVETRLRCQADYLYLGRVVARVNREDLGTEEVHQLYDAAESRVNANIKAVQEERFSYCAIKKVELEKLEAAIKAAKETTP
jgi:hypothetical protein